MIKIEGVSKDYGSGNAVSHMNLEIKDGEIFGLLGPNGAGKTTTIKMITGITEPTEGTVSINGFDICKKSLEAKKQFGYVPDSPDMFLKFTGIEYINFMADVYGVSKKEREGRINELAKTFEMEHALGETIDSYSHGMRQKIVIIGVLIHNPRAWILDEPLTGLDPKSAFILKDMMRKHADDGNSVLFSTHVLEVAEKVCDRVGIIKKGELIFVGTLEELKDKFEEDESLEKIFLEITENE
ncbi:ABC transporter ATP-binding protein [uncultured Clostridium sp.]|uniref:ABC transporter ATP-binding protein n=1 Tax=uncultured Clostridium sp. TaxID=59620 RepID=UPI00261E9DF3|nr:ABC transporter ATP-binding protein [uncultured Clostridium sp.]